MKILTPMTNQTVSCIMPGRFNGKIEKYIELSFLEWNLYFEHTGFRSSLWCRGELWTCNPKVSGSIPGASNLKKLLIWMKIHGFPQNHN